MKAGGTRVQGGTDQDTQDNNKVNQIKKKLRSPTDQLDICNSQGWEVKATLGYLGSSKAAWATYTTKQPTANRLGHSSGILSMGLRPPSNPS